ncbi:MAG: hypothetical protein NZ850_08795, partial [Caldimicrobium sp.]|nr:hypothetical protein [Caldimicrobium sp.]
TLWQQIFPEAKVIPRIYDRSLFPDGDVILDFLSILGIEMPEARTCKIEANPSLSVISTLALRKINEKFNLSVEEHKKVVKYLISIDREEGSPIKSFFTLPERIEFLEHFRESNERLFREWFGTENKFVLSEEEIKFYEEQDKISKEEIDKMVEDRYRKVLAYLMEENTKQPLFKNFSKPKIVYSFIDKIEFMRIDTVHLDLLKSKLTIGGLVLLKKDVDDDRLLVRTDAKEREVEWGLPSPGLASKFPDNPKAKNARFRITDLEPTSGNIEIYLGKDKIIDIKF